MNTFYGVMAGNKLEGRLLCATQEEAAEAAKRLSMQGHNDVYVMEIKAITKAEVKIELSPVDGEQP